MTAYQWCDLTVVTAIEFPELMTARPGAAPSRTWQLFMATGRPTRARRRWFHRWRFPDGRRWVAFARDDAGYLLRFPALADFYLRPDERTIACYPAPGAPAHTIRHLLLDQLLPLVAGGRDRLALHGSVAATPAGAVMFLAGPGYGKSTLAATLAHRGCPLLSDDCGLLVRGADGAFDAVPSYPGVRLAPDSIQHLYGAGAGGFTPVAHYTTKRRVTAEVPFRGTPVRLARIYVMGERAELEQASQVEIRVPVRRAALFDLLNYTFHLDVGHPPRIREAFELAADVVAAHDVRHLVFPWALANADAIADAILADLA